MFDNIGNKIKILAKVLCWIGIVLCVIVAMVMFVLSSQTDSLQMDSVKSKFLWCGFAFLILGPLFSWIGSFVLYGFGELINNSAIIAQQSNRSNQIYNKKMEEQHKKEKEQRKENIRGQILDDNVSEDCYIDIQCPHCDADLSYTRYELLQNEFIVCPNCDEQFSTSFFKE